MRAEKPDVAHAKRVVDGDNQPRSGNSLSTCSTEKPELIALRDNNAHRERRFLCSMADKELVKEPGCLTRPRTSDFPSRRARKTVKKW